MSADPPDKRVHHRSAIGSWSITTRLTILYAVSTFGLLVVATMFLYWMMGADLDLADRKLLSERAQILWTILQEFPDNQSALVEELGLGAYDARLLDDTGRTLLETPGMSARLPADRFPPPATYDRKPKAAVSKWGNGAQSYLMMSLWVPVGRAGQPQAVLQIALDVSSEDAIAAGYRRRLVVVLVAGLLFAAAAGATVARRGMRPLAEITRAATRISAAQLHERVNPAQWPRELTALATAFDQMLDRLEASFARLSQFSADLAHELRTPINNLMGEADVALSRVRTPEEYRKVLESSLEEFAKLSRTIDGLLFLARADHPDTQIQRAALDARKEIEAVREFFDAMAQEQGVEVVCDGDATLRADPLLFRRAVSNLLSNALQYTPRGGRVVMSAAGSPDRGAVIRVRDTGLGIEAEHLKKIFDRFYRVDRARSHFPRGVGLGLAIMKSIMDLHHGVVTVDSEPGKGTTVSLQFPPA
ncbi:MAG TPA: heavy metal sensor histidine kinase [Nitrospiria bacterium]|nr:heavy metal sensor histidine kinase [Nitrospiria bacterium]